MTPQAIEQVPLQFQVVNPMNYGWFMSRLPQQHIDYLWRIINKKKGESHKEHLIGNISSSYVLEDENDYFFFVALLFFLEGRLYYKVQSILHEERGCSMILRVDYLYRSLRLFPTSLE